MKTIHLFALSPGMVYNPALMLPGNGKSYNEAEVDDEDMLEDENLEDEDLPDEAPEPQADALSYVANDSKTPPEKEESDFEVNDMDEK